MQTFEPKFVWTINCYLLPDECKILKAIYAESDYLRRTPPYGGAEIWLDDGNETYEERLPRTRAIIPNTTLITIGDTHISYHARFKTWMVKPPEFEEVGRVNTVSFTLQEASSTTPTDDSFTTGSLTLDSGSKTYDKYFEFTQSANLTTWIIVHNLNKKPSVRCTDESGEEIIGEIVDIDANSLTITFSQPTKGKAYLN